MYFVFVVWFYCLLTVVICTMNLFNCWLDLDLWGTAPLLEIQTPFWVLVGWHGINRNNNCVICGNQNMCFIVVLWCKSTKAERMFRYYYITDFGFCLYILNIKGFLFFLIPNITLNISTIFQLMVRINLRIKMSDDLQFFRTITMILLSQLK